MTDYLGIKPLPDKPPSHDDTANYINGVCARPGHNIITHCIEPKNHEGQHTYSPVPEDAESMSDRLEGVMRLLTTSCPDYMVADFTTPKPGCCAYHKAAKVVMETQEILRRMRR